MTIDEIKVKRPSVIVYLDGREFLCPIVKHKNDSIGHLLLNVNGERQVLEFTWSAIARAVNQGEILMG